MLEKDVSSIQERKCDMFASVSARKHIMSRDLLVEYVIVHR